MIVEYLVSNHGNSIHVDASYQVWFIWLGSFRGEDFLDIDQSETRIACGGHVC
jgi:hypothetical protein